MAQADLRRTAWFLSSESRRQAFESRGSFPQAGWRYLSFTGDADPKRVIEIGGSPSHSHLHPTEERRQQRGSSPCGL